MSRRVEQWLITAPQETFEAILEVTQERSRQEEIGWTAEHDAMHGSEHLISEAYKRLLIAHLSPSAEPRDIVKAAALLIAALEQLEREAVEA